MRVEINRALRQALDLISDVQYDFKIGFAYRMGDGSFELPCLWVCPHELANKTGRKEGVETYMGVFYILESVVDLTEEDKNIIWDKMDNLAYGVLNHIADEENNNIISIENIKCQPDEYAYTGYNAISMKVSFDVKIQYCECRE